MKNSALRYWSKKLLTRGSRPRIIIISLVATIIVGLGLFLVFGGSAAAGAKGTKSTGYSKSAIMDAWSAGEKSKVLEKTRSSLEAEPTDTFYLSFDGIAAYYSAMESPEGDEKQNLLDEAVFSLRKALDLGDKVPIKPQIEYVLGKTYFQKGAPWFDLAIEYLIVSIKDGYKSDDSEQYLGLAYAGLLDHVKAVEHFEIALKNNSADILKLSAAVSYNELGDKTKAAELLTQVVQSANDALVVQRARFLLADKALKENSFAEAEKQLQAIIDADPRSAEAWYQLGMVYASFKDPIKARAAWRKATSIDPNNIEARKKLAERL
jgi:tetratricopeptide (TPR) repeat protein